MRDKRVEGIADIRDESDRHGMRVVIELKRDASGDVVLNQLYRFSELQTSFGVNMLALNDGRPVQMNLKELIARLRRVPRGSGHPAHASSNSPRRATAAISWSAWPSRSPISTR